MDFDEGMEFDGEFGAGLSDFAFEMEMELEGESCCSSSRASSVDLNDLCTSYRSVHASSFSIIPLAPRASSSNSSPTCVANEATNNDSWEVAFAEAFKGLGSSHADPKCMTSYQRSRFQPVAGCAAG